jgi:hypothetical protein
MHPDRCGNTRGRKCHEKGSGKEAKIQEVMYTYRDTMNVEYELCEYTGSNWSHRNSNKSFRETFGSHTRKTFSRFTKTDSCMRNITHLTESAAV